MDAQIKLDGFLNFDSIVLSSIGANVPINARKKDIYVVTFIILITPLLIKSTKAVQETNNKRIVFVNSILGSTKTENDFTLYFICSIMSKLSYEIFN